MKERNSMVKNAANVKKTQHFIIGDLEPTPSEMKLIPSLTMYLSTTKNVQEEDGSDFEANPPIIPHVMKVGKNKVGSVIGETSKCKRKSKERYFHNENLKDVNVQETVVEVHNNWKGHLMDKTPPSRSPERIHVNNKDAEGVVSESMKEKVRK